MTTNLDPVAVSVFVFFFALVTVLGFIASRWRAPKTMAHIDEWGLGGRNFGTWITWFLVGGDFYTAYTVIAVPALVYAVGAYGFFALPYTIIVYPFVFMVMPLLWKRAKDNGYVTAGDVVFGQYGSRGLELAVALTGVIATMPYIALQLVGMAAVLQALGLTGELPLAVAFVILALYTYSAGLRAPALIAFVKDIMIYIAVIAAVALIPSKLGGYANVFASADAAFKAKGSGNLLLGGNQYVAYATLALGSALAAFMYPHTLTGIFASNSGNTIRKNAVMLPAYTLLLGPAGLYGPRRPSQRLQPEPGGSGAVSDPVPQLVRRFCLRRHCHRRAGSRRGHEHRGLQSLHPQFLEGLCQSSGDGCGGGEGRQGDVADHQDRCAAGHCLPADAVCIGPAAARRHLDPADASGAGVRALLELVPCTGPAGRMARRLLRRHLSGVDQRPEAAAGHQPRRRTVHGLYRAAGARCQCCRGGTGQSRHGPGEKACVR